MSAPSKITFFEFLTPLIKAGKKTITIRDASEAHYVPGSSVAVYVLETNEKVCNIRILSVEPLAFDDINQGHAEQEYMDLDRLKTLIREIYPNTDSLFEIHYTLID
jgi:uncharacterized protein YqfB (UPF0267 family)